MDRLKQINDTYGHLAGDFAIRLIGHATRRSAPKEALPARVGGDEFLVVIPRATKKDAEKYIQDFQRELETLNQLEDRAFRVSASCGAVVFRLDSLSSIEECIQKSDEEMYRQKGKNKAGRGE